MLPEVVVTGIGLASCLGNLATTWQKLSLNQTGIGVAQPYPNLPSYPLGLIGVNPNNWISLTDKIVSEAIADARLEIPIRDCGVVIGSSRAAQASWEAILSRDQEIAAIDWQTTLPQGASVQVARKIQTQSPVLAPMAACATGIWAIAQGLSLIERGDCSRVIAGAVEAPITPLTLASFARMQALAKTGCYPFAREREGLVLGEGGAILVLETKELAERRGAHIYGKVDGFGLTCDADHLNAPEATGKLGIAAIKRCLDNSNLSPQAIDYIHAHGTGTRLNDAREARIINSLFNHKVKVSSTKGATGHTLGASGAMGAAFCLMALHRQQLPPSVGKGICAFDLNLVTSNQSTTVRHTLCFSFGFGGQNAILALSNVE